MSHLRPLFVLTVIAVAAPAAARAQASQAPPPLPFEQIAGALQPGRWRYQATRVGDGPREDFGTRTLTLEKESGSDRWLFLDAQTNSMATLSDTVVLAARDLATQRRAMSVESPMGAVKLAMAFTPDSVTGSMTAGGQSQTIAAANVRGAISNDGLILLALGKLPLAAGWTGRAEILNPQNGGTIPLDLAVRREEKVGGPTGTFDTWVVETVGGPATASFYVAKGGPVVKVVTAIPQGGSIEAVLTK